MGMTQPSTTSQTTATQDPFRHVNDLGDPAFLAAITEPITAESIQAELVAQAAEILELAEHPDVTIAADALVIADVVTRNPATAAPRSARAMLHTALADARTQMWRAIEERKAAERQAEVDEAHELYAKFQQIFS